MLMLFDPFVSFVVSKAGMDASRGVRWGSRKTVAAVVCLVVVSKVLSWSRSWTRRRRLNTLRTKKKAESREALQRLADRLKGSKLTPADVEAIVQLSFAELQAKLQSGELKALRVLQAYQIKALEAHAETNCLIEPILEAEALAEACDAATESLGPLHGVPISIKETYGLEGYDTTAGLAKKIGKPGLADAVVVQVLKEAGAVPFVRTNVPHVCMSYESSNPIYGATTNPHDTGRSPGGSSGGEAALIGAGGSVLGMGSDIAGSIRIPAHFCGIYGLKSTPGRLSGKNNWSMNRGQTLVQTSLGPMGRDMEGLVATMKLLLSPRMFELDPCMPKMPFRHEEYEDRRPLRIGFLVDDGYFTPVPACQRAVRVAKGVLEQQGHEVVPWKFPADTVYAMNDLIKSATADKWRKIRALLEDDQIDPCMARTVSVTTIPGLIRRPLAFVLGLLDKRIGGTFSASAGNTIDGWYQHVERIMLMRDMFASEWKKSGLDALICPAFGCVATPLGMAGNLPGVASYTGRFNLLNLAAGVAPVTHVTAEDERALQEDYPTRRIDPWARYLKKAMKGSEGLPVCVQVATLPFQEETCLRVMKHIEDGLKAN